MLKTFQSTSIISTTAKSLLSAIPNLTVQPNRTTVIVKRKFPCRLYPKYGKPSKMTHREYIYEVVENTNYKKRPPLDIILTQYVEGYGEKGDKLSMSSYKAYNEFLLPGLAVYASPENIEKYLNREEKRELTYSSKYVPILMNILKKCCLIVNMSIENTWVIEKWHVRANFRRIGIILSDDTLQLPEKQINGPNLDWEGKEFYVYVTINKTEKVPVRCRLHHVTYDFSKELLLEPGWMKVSGQAIFPEDQEFLDSLPRPKWEENIQAEKE